MKTIFWSFIAIATFDHFTGIVSAQAGLPAPPLKMINLGQPPPETPCPQKNIAVQEI
ncbi:MAG: hypothetical protein ACFCA4_12500 [Cyanophyceae cyanobacterium]